MFQEKSSQGLNESWQPPCLLEVSADGVVLCVICLSCVCTGADVVHSVFWLCVRVCLYSICFVLCLCCVCFYCVLTVCVCVYLCLCTSRCWPRRWWPTCQLSPTSCPDCLRAHSKYLFFCCSMSVCNRGLSAWHHHHTCKLRLRSNLFNPPPCKSGLLAKFTN